MAWLSARKIGRKVDFSPAVCYTLPDRRRRLDGRRRPRKSWGMQYEKWLAQEMGGRYSGIGVLVLDAAVAAAVFLPTRPMVEPADNPSVGFVSADFGRDGETYSADIPGSELPDGWRTPS